MKTSTAAPIRQALMAAAALVFAAAPAALAQVKVVDMIPKAMSNETNFDTEPYVNVNPADPRLIAATAFLLTPLGSPNGPLLVSFDGGATWETKNVIPSSSGGLNTFDATIGFNSAGTAFYTGILRDSTVDLEVQRTTDLTFATPLTILNTPRGTDQPYLYARTVTGPPDAGKDRVWVGNNEGAAGPASATIDQSLDSGIPTPTFAQVRADAGSPVGRDNYQVRTVANADGHVYAAFYRRRGSIAGGYNADVVVVRDDNWGLTSPAFRSVVDSVTSVAGQNVAVSTPVSDTLGSSVALGSEWWGGDLYLTVDPSDSSRVYVSYSDSRPGAARTLHLRRSTDSGQTWGADLITTPSAKNAAIAVTPQGTIGYLYQQLAGASPNLRWQTHLRRSTDGGASWDNVTLATFPAEGSGSPGGSRIVGDYLNMVAVGEDFYGVFSSYNDLVNATFPAGVTFLRNRTLDGDPSPRLLGDDGVTTVNPSIDPFFFVAKGPQPQIQVPGNVDLGNTCVGSKSAGTLNVCNTGKADLKVSAISSSNPGFSVTAPSAGFPVVISHDFCFPFQVVFDATTAGPQTATLTIQSNDPDHPSIGVTANGSGGGPDIRVTGSPDFGVVSAWGPGEKTLRVCNTGTCDLSVASAAVACADFTLINSPFPAVVSHDSCLDLVVRFTPTRQCPRACNLAVASNDPDTPVVNRTLTARTPALFSLHAGLANPHGAFHGVAKQGSTFNLDFVYPFQPRWAWDVRLGRSKFDGRAGHPDTDVASLSANARFTLNPGAPVHVFLNAGLGGYHFDPGNFEGGGNLGLGLNVPVGRRFALEATYNYHWVLTASPTLQFDQIQLGLLISF